MNTPTRTDSLSAWLDYMASIHVSAIDMGLERVLPVFEHLGIQKNAFVFTVAGTNGKGSTTATIAQICQNAGLKVALYQSPQLVSFNERVRIDGQMASDETLIDAFVAIEQARRACGLTLSFFEMTTLAGLHIFAQSKCDVWVLEVGLGGRLDVVNVIDPDVCVITNVAIDHTDWLGDTREKIGFEKAGIVRDGVPVIYGETDIPTSVLDVIKDKNAKLYQRGVAFDCVRTDDGFIYSSKGVTLALPLPTLALDNACVAVSAVLASPLGVSYDAICNGLKTVKLAGRFDVRAIKGRTFVFDVAHNEAGVGFLLGQFVPFWQTQKGELHAVFSMLADKDIDAVLAVVARANLSIKSWHIATLDNSRAMAVDALFDKVQSALPNAQIYRYDTMAQANQGVLDVSQAGDGVLVFGSFYTISESLIALGECANPRA